jgi:hypothetical protein
MVYSYVVGSVRSFLGTPYDNAHPRPFQERVAGEWLHISRLNLGGRVCPLLVRCDQIRTCWLHTRGVALWRLVDPTAAQHAVLVVNDA